MKWSHPASESFRKTPAQHARIIFQSLRSLLSGDKPAALGMLLRFQAWGKLRRLKGILSSPRRMILTGLGLLLAIVWLGNVLLAIFLREPYHPETLRRTLAGGFAVYTLWHFVKLAWQRMELGIEWTPAERELLLSAPVTRTQIVAYRLTIILASASMKAGLATLLLMPDLRVAWLGLFALCLVMTLIELTRFCVETFLSALKQREYLGYRFLVLSLFGSAILWALGTTIRDFSPEQNNPMPVTLLFLKDFAAHLALLGQSAVMRPVLMFFDLYARIITAQQVSIEIFGLLGIAILVVSFWAFMAIRIDRWADERLLKREQQLLKESQRRTGSGLDNRGSQPFPQVWLGPIAWRQLQNARRQLGGILLALLAPGLLSLIPLAMLKHHGPAAYGNFLASLAFYSLLLLPAALKYDFRRDYDQFSVLKMLPFRSRQVVIGQLMTPVLISTLFQWSMILLGWLIQPVPFSYVVAALLIFPPVNVAIYGMDNLLFLMFPYRMHQEGIDVFVRTTLTFTAKGLAFALFLVCILLWSVAARALAERLDGGVLAHTQLIFGVGVWVLFALIGWGTISLSARIFHHLDPRLGGVS